MVAKVKVGDKLVFRTNRITGDFVEIIPVERVTASGRIICGRFTLNPDLSIRGKRDAWSGAPFEGELLSDTEMEALLAEQRERVERRRIISDIRKNADWDRKPIELLRQIRDLVAE